MTPLNLPWHIEHDCICDATGDTVTAYDAFPDDPYAPYVVRAVNAHADLLAALVALREAIGHVYTHGDSESNWAAVTAASLAAKDAIAKAAGE